MYEKGHGVPQSYAEAVKWYRMAAEQGENRAQAQLGIKYALGKGVSMNYEHAYFWFLLAAVSGEVTDAELRDLTAEQLTQQQIAKVQAEATAWQPKPAR